MIRKFSRKICPECGNNYCLRNSQVFLDKHCPEPEREFVRGVQRLLDTYVRNLMDEREASLKEE